MRFGHGGFYFRIMPHPDVSSFARTAFGVMGCAIATAVVAAPTPSIPTFSNVSVHDPSVVKAGDRFYVFGSHLASASTPDWLHWTQISTSPDPGNALVPNPPVEFQEALAWTGDNSAFWAPDVRQLGDGRYYFYYCVGRLDQPRAALGIAVSNAVTGPYSNVGIILKSGMWGQPSPDGTIYDPTKHPNTVDPAVFFDQTGRLWMVYGSYSGGIFIMQLDPVTGFPLPGQGYGKKLIGGNHVRIEGPYILYSPESGYYYLFLSFGGFASDGGYNVRVGRSRNPDGPYFDAAGNDLTNVSGPPGTLFDDAAIEPYGVKLIGNYQFLPMPGEPAQTTRGYLSPGHNSAYYDPVRHQYFFVFHTRFVGRGEEHEVRVHEMFINADGWPVVAPQRYAGESSERAGPEDVRGDYKLITHSKAITAAVNPSVNVTLEANHTVSGAVTGSWWWSPGNRLTLTLGGTTYRGVFDVEWDDDNGAWVHAFTAVAGNGVAIWGSKTVVSNHPADTITLPDRAALYGETFTLAMPMPRSHGHHAYTYSLANGPTGMAVDRVSGIVTWSPGLTQVGTVFPVTVRATDASTDPEQTLYSFNVTALSEFRVRRVDLDFSRAATQGLRDANGVFTGLTTRLPGTGGALPSLDPNLLLDPTAGLLKLSTTRGDFNGGAGLAGTSTPGIALADLGFTGGEDFSATAVFRPLPGIEFIDQVGLYVGAAGNTLTRAGTIVFATPERYSTHTIGGGDTGGHFFGFGFNGADGMTVTISRSSGVWHYFVDGVEWNPVTPASFLDGRSDLVTGLFAITPLNGNVKVVDVDAFSVVSATAERALSLYQAWRIHHFAVVKGTGIAADTADPDHDGLPNLYEYALGTDPLSFDMLGNVFQYGTSGTPARMTLTFNRIADPTLVYTVEASSRLNSGYAPIWSSTGPANTAGPVTVTDIVDLGSTAHRYLRLRVSD
jgi:beta-xylosidase